MGVSAILTVWVPAQGWASGAPARLQRVSVSEKSLGKSDKNKTRSEGQSPCYNVIVSSKSERFPSKKAVDFFQASFYE